MDALGMLTVDPDAVRVQHPTERVHIHPHIWSAIELGKSRGLLSLEAAERLIDGLRQVDTRDWDVSDVRSVIREILKVSGEMAPGIDVERVLLDPRKRRRDHYH